MEPIETPLRDFVSAVKHKSRKPQYRFGVSAGITGLSGVAALTLAVAGLPVGLPIIVGAVAGTVAVPAFRAVRAWEDPVVTLEVKVPGGKRPIQRGGTVLLGSTVVGNYRRVARVSPLPKATLTGHLILTEKSIRGDTWSYIDESVRVPIDVLYKISDNAVDVDFEVVVPITNAAPTLQLGPNEAKWHLELLLETKVGKDAQKFDIVVIPEIAPHAYEDAPGQGLEP